MRIRKESTARPANGAWGTCRARSLPVSNRRRARTGPLLSPKPATAGKTQAQYPPARLYSPHLPPVTRVLAILSSPVYTDTVLRRELYLLALYRLLEACLLALIVFSPVGEAVGELHDPLLAHTVSVAYLAAALVLLFASRRQAEHMGEVALAGVCMDVVVAVLVTHAQPAAGAGVALMLLVNLGGAALFVRLSVALAVAAFAAVAISLEFLWSQLEGNHPGRPFAELLMFSSSFMATVLLTHQLGQRLRQSHALARQHGEQAESLAGINELIIRRMRTAVMMVDGSRHIRLANEAAQRLFANFEQGLDGRRLSDLSPSLAQSLERWLQHSGTEEAPIAVGVEQTEVQPRFARLLNGGDAVLVFLDDTSLISRRAESLTLSAMGRFSASLAHEIRNPLAAISYSVQLLEESHDISDGDRRLLQIIHQQCQRTNGIVESVLGLARRERANAEPIDLVAFVRRYVDEQQQVTAPENGTLQRAGRERSLTGLFDPRHLHQVLTILVNNAFHYGRLPGQLARVSIVVEERDGRPTIEVCDRGPGVPEAVVPQLGRPFFTTSEHGTGLGLYIARELCHANGGRLDYVAVPGGGACFRITMSGRGALLSHPSQAPA